MLSSTQTENILTLNSQGLNQSQIAKKLNVSRAVVRSRINGFKPIKEDFDPSKLSYNEYAYLLGVYLGDGYISKLGRTFRLRIYLHLNEIEIRNRVIHSLEKILSDNKISFGQYDRGVKCTVISCYSNLLPQLFPQHGIGKKNSREIILVPWQMEILEKSYEFLLCGLIDSDGTYYEEKGQGRYNFTNTSVDIINIFKKYYQYDINEFVNRHSQRNDNWNDTHILRIRDKIGVDRFATLMETCYSSL